MAKRTPIATPPASLMAGPNREVFVHLHGKSAHSDIVEVLWTSIKGLPGVDIYCSDRNNFGYIVACTNGLVFAYAAGMHGVTLRLPEERVNALITEGAEPLVSVGPKWALLKLFGDGGFEHLLAENAREAYNYAAGPSN